MTTNAAAARLAGHTAVLVYDVQGVKAKLIETVEPGDKIVSLNYENRRHAVSVVTNVRRHAAGEITGYWLINGTSITGDSPVLVHKTWRTVEGLRTKEKLTELFGGKCILRTKWPVPIGIETFSLCAEGDWDNFFADGFAVRALSFPGCSA